MLVTLLAAAVLGQQQGSGLETPVTMEAKNSTVPGIMLELEKQSGVKIHVQGAPLQDYVYARFTNRPLKSALDVLAKACESKWSVSNGEVYFSAPWPPDGDEAYAARLKMITEWLEKNPVPAAMSKSAADKIIADSLALQSSNLPDVYQKSSKLYQGTPLPRAHLRLLHALGAKELASVPTGETQVYMVTAKGRVRALPGSTPNIFKDFNGERDMYRQLLLNHGVDDNFQSEGSVWMPSLQSYSQMSRPEIGWMLLIHNEQYGLQSELRGFVEYEQGWTNMSSNDSQMIGGNMISFEPPDPSKDPFAKFTDPYTPPAEWKENITMSGPGQQGMPVISDLLKKRLANMDTDEVLTDYVHDPLHILGESTKKDVVAILSDIGFIGVIFGSAQTSNLGAALRNSMMGQGKLEEFDGAILLSPTPLVNSRRGRIARPSTANYIRTAQAIGAPDLDASADLAVSMDDDTALMYAMSIAALVIGEEPNNYMSNMDVLRLYGHLSDTQRKQAKGQGLSMSFSSLSKKQQAIINKLMNARNAGLSPKDSELDIENSTQGGWEYDDIIQLKLPQGIPANARVTFRSEKRNKLFGQMEMEGGFKYVSEASIESAAWGKAYEEAGYPEYYGSRTNSFTFADRLFLQVVVDLGELGYFAQTLPIGSPGKDAKFVPIEQLPKEMQDEYNRQLKQAREQVKEMGPPPTGGTRRTPPP